jgi:hypothetical protein
MDIAFRKHIAPLSDVLLWMNLQVADLTQDTNREKLFDLNYQ